MHVLGSWRRGRTGVAAAAALPFAVLAAPLGAGPPQPFTEEAIARGINYTTAELTIGSGHAAVDLDDDGDPDFVTVGAATGIVGVYENAGGGVFIDRSAMTGIGPLPKASGVIAADYDRDGDLDLYIPRWDEANALLRHEGGFVFTNATNQSGVGDEEKGTGCAWGDYDGDGWMDLYVANRFGPHRLFRNQGDGTFLDVTAALGVDPPGEGSYQASFLDYDLDGDSDLYVTIIRGFCTAPDFHRSRLYQNLGGVFLDVTDVAGAGACVDAMSVGIGDFDNNGYHDVYVTNIPDGNALLMNTGSGTFVHAEVATQTATYLLGWGAVFFDYDNDGHSDLYVCNQLDPNRLYVHGGSWPCVDVAPALGVDVGGASFVTATADVDGDGDLDFFLQNLDEPIRLFINHEGESRRWAMFDVIGEGPNRYAIGATIVVRIGTVHQIREVVAGCNYKGQNQLVQHVGLDGARFIDEVLVTWPGGNARSLTGLGTDATWTLFPADKLGDGDGDGDRDLEDFWLFDACFTGDAPGALAPGCEMMDYEGDADVDLVDFDGFLAAYDGPLEDCNGNGSPDLLDILDGSATDGDGDGVPDECRAVPGDLTGDGLVNIADLLVLLAAWGQTGSPADLNDDGTVNLQDLLLLLSLWSP